MPHQGPETHGSRPALLVGAGRRPVELGAVLAALAAARTEGEASAVPEPGRAAGLRDLEELLSRPRTPTSTGTLILDCEHVAPEDLGFVRRFLERSPGWRLIAVGEEAGDRVARALLALPRAQWLPWPPDLDQIGALLDGRVARRPSAPSPEPGEDGEVEQIDVGRLLEELLASASLEGDGNPRTHFSREHELPVRRERAALAEGLARLVTLARRCAGERGDLHASAEPAPAAGDPPETVRLRIDFPAGPLREEDWAGLLDQPFSGDPAVADAVADAGRGAAALRAAGCRVNLFTRRPDRLRLELHVASGPLASTGAPKPGKPQDPFA